MTRTRSYIICQRIQNNKHSSHNTICLLDMMIEHAVGCVWSERAINENEIGFGKRAATAGGNMT